MTTHGLAFESAVLANIKKSSLTNTQTRECWSTSRPLYLVGNEEGIKYGWFPRGGFNQLMLAQLYYICEMRNALEYTSFSGSDKLII